MYRIIAVGEEESQQHQAPFLETFRPGGTPAKLANDPNKSKRTFLETLNSFISTCRKMEHKKYFFYFELKNKN